ncbi:hypothetical protein NY08_1095 [Rhodococcus sp. B7740]|nr:hypothetical protein NY08_1095 [Rhodococcus sp. B7740]
MSARLLPNSHCVSSHDCRSLALGHLLTRHRHAGCLSTATLRRLRARATPRPQPREPTTVRLLRPMVDGGVCTSNSQGTQSEEYVAYE